MNNPRRQYRFTTLFLILITAALVIPWAVGTIYTTSNLNESLTEQINRENDLTLEIVVENLVHFFNEPVMELQMLKEMMGKALSSQQHFEALQTIGHQLRYFERLVLVDSHEDVVATWPVNENLIGTNQSGKKYLEKLNKLPQDYFWSAASTDYFTGKTAIDLVVPLENGYLSGTVMLDNLQGMLDGMKGRSEAIIGIVDVNGSYLAHSDNAMVSQRMKDPLIFRALSGEKSVLETITINQQVYLPDTRDVKGTDWTIVSYYPQNKAREPVDQILRHVMEIQGFTLLIITVLLLMLGRIVQTQINRIKDFTKRIAGGSYDLTEPAPMFMEMGHIIAHFESMADKVQDREMEIIAQNEEIFAMNEELESRVQERTQQLEGANAELEGFSYTVSHDLRAPLRHIAGFVDLLGKQLPESTDEKSRHYLSVISGAAARMEQLIDDLLSFSRMGRVEMMNRRVDNNALVKEVRETLESETAGRQVSWQIHPLQDARGDQEMLRLVWINLISNALKFSRDKKSAIIEIGTVSDHEENSPETIYFVKDNGTGFDMRYKDNLFKIFQRLHRQEEFEGTGIGLANVHRIISRHGGRIWAESVVGSGAVFYFTLPAVREAF